MTDTLELQTESQTLWLLAELSSETPARERLVSLREALQQAQAKVPDDPQAALWLAGLEAALADEAGWLEVQKDYVRLFAAVYKDGGPVAPMQSAVMPDRGDMTQLEAHISQLCRASGFTLPEGHSHAHDHVSTLLFLLSAQRFGEAQAREAGDEDAIHRYHHLFWRTFSDYLQPWAAAWAEQAAQHARSPFYKAWLAGFNEVMHHFRTLKETEDL
ncbi:MAG: hypothetical protein D6758_09950 [Gammaproteobacteria bacterium]|nr:MAG: hypothetical protein D6758_09950 [Gammaproteobacteria bacterium]